MIIKKNTFFFKTKTCSNDDDLFISCNDRSGKMFHNICMSAVAVSLRWAGCSTWASCFNFFSSEEDWLLFKGLLQGDSFIWVIVSEKNKKKIDISWYNITCRAKMLSAEFLTQHAKCTKYSVIEIVYFSFEICCISPTPTSCYIYHSFNLHHFMGMAYSADYTTLWAYRYQADSKLITFSLLKFSCKITGKENISKFGLLKFLPRLASALSMKSCIIYLPCPSKARSYMYHCTKIDFFSSTIIFLYV